MTQEEPIFQFKSKDRKKPVSQFEGLLLFGWDPGFLINQLDEAHPHREGDLFYLVYHFISFKYLFIYLAAPGLSCDMQILSWGMCAQVLWPQTSLAPLHWEYGVLAPGPPEVLTVSF